MEDNHTLPTRIKDSTLARLRAKYPEYKGETMADYLDRVIREVKQNE